MAVKPRAPGRARTFLDAYTKGFTREEFQRLFTRDAREAYRFFARTVDEEALARLPWHKRFIVRARLLFWAFTLKLSPARRVLFGVGLLFAAFGFLQLFRGFAVVGFPIFLGPVTVRVGMPMPQWGEGAFSLLVGFLLVNLLVLLEVADRLTLKNDLEIARDIQHAMLPQAMYSDAHIEAYGLTRPANTVGGDFYDVLPLQDGRIILTLGDVAGKGSPAALLMALLLAMFRTLVDEGLEASELAARLNVQVARHAPASRFITLFFAACDPTTGRLVYVNAGHMPALLRRRSGAFEKLTGRRHRARHVRLLHLRGARDGARARRRPGPLQRRRDRGGEPQRAAVRGVGPRARRGYSRGRVTKRDRAGNSTGGGGPRPGNPPGRRCDAAGGEEAAGSGADGAASAAGRRRRGGQVLNRNGRRGVKLIKTG